MFYHSYFTLCKISSHISSKVASYCRDQTGLFPLFKRHPVCKQSIMDAGVTSGVEDNSHSH